MLNVCLVRYHFEGGLISLILIYDGSGIQNILVTNHNNIFHTRGQARLIITVITPIKTFGHWNIYLAIGFTVDRMCRLSYWYIVPLSLRRISMKHRIELYISIYLCKYKTLLHLLLMDWSGELLLFIHSRDYHIYIDYIFIHVYLYHSWNKIVYEVRQIFFSCISLLQNAMYSHLLTICTILLRIQPFCELSQSVRHVAIFLDLLSIFCRKMWEDFRNAMEFDSILTGDSNNKLL